MATKRKRKRPRKGSKSKCLHCTRPAQFRGCCKPCRRRIAAAIKAGKFTDEQAVEAHLLLPINRSGRNPAAEHLNALIRKVSDEHPANGNGTHKRRS